MLLGINFTELRYEYRKNLIKTIKMVNDFHHNHPNYYWDTPKDPYTPLVDKYTIPTPYTMRAVLAELKIIDPAIPSTSQVWVEKFKKLNSTKIKQEVTLEIRHLFNTLAGSFMNLLVYLYDFCIEQGVALRYHTKPPLFKVLKKPFESLNFAESFVIARKQFVKNTYLAKWLLLVVFFNLWEKAQYLSVTQSLTKVIKNTSKISYGYPKLGQLAILSLVLVSGAAVHTLLYLEIIKSAISFVLFSVKCINSTIGTASIIYASSLGFLILGTHIMSTSLVQTSSVINNIYRTITK